MPTPGTRVSVSVSAYTSVGQGMPANLTDLMIPTIYEFIRLITIRFEYPLAHTILVLFSLQFNFVF